MQLRVTARDYSETVVASGVLKLEEETDLVAEVSGTVEAFYAQAGDAVTAGAILLSIGSPDNQLDLDSALAAYENARANYDQLISVDYPAAVAELSYRSSLKEQAAKEYRDAQTLYSEGAISQNDLSLKQVQMDSAYAQWSAASLRASSMSAGGSQLLSAQADLDAAKAQYEKAEGKAGKYEIAAPWDAILLQSYVNPRDRVEPGKVLGRIGKQGGYYVTTELGEKYFPYIDKEKEVTISVGDGRMGAMTGRIARITPAINPGTGTFEVMISIPEDFPYQASGLSVNIDIILLQVRDAVVVPAAYIIEADGQEYVLLQSGAAYQRKQVDVIRGSGSDVVVIRGLEEGQTIELPGDINESSGTI
jgi:multidrug efflux pump subunit AcrA (membrane-fusion protein)